MDSIPLGLCQCGCGQPTKLATYTYKSRGVQRGQPLRFLQGHNARLRALAIVIPNPGGLCLCGCGQPTPIATATNRNVGQEKGIPLRYIRGHNGRRTYPERWRWKTCQHCGQSYHSQNDKYCSRVCAGLGRRSNEKHRRGMVRWRRAVRERDLVCRDCGGSDNLHAHHLLDWALYPALRLDPDNGILLCTKCHRQRHPTVKCLGVGKRTGPLRQCRTCAKALSSGTVGDYCRAHMDHSYPRPGRRRPGYRDNYRKGLACSVCGVAIHNSSKTGRCGKHWRQPI